MDKIVVFTSNIEKLFTQQKSLEDEINTETLKQGKKEDDKKRQESNKKYEEK